MLLYFSGLILGMSVPPDPTNLLSEENSALEDLADLQTSHPLYFQLIVLIIILLRC